MNSSEIQNNVKKVIDEFDQEEFIYDLLLAYGISKASIKRLKLGDYNLSDDEGTILFKKKIFFKKERPYKLLQTIESMSVKEEVRKHAPRFLMATDYRTLVAKRKFAILANLRLIISDLQDIHYTPFWASQDIFRGA